MNVSFVGRTPAAKDSRAHGGVSDGKIRPGQPIASSRLCAASANRHNVATAPAGPPISSLRLSWLGLAPAAA